VFVASMRSAPSSNTRCFGGRREHEDFGHTYPLPLFTFGALGRGRAYWSAPSSNTRRHNSSQGRLMAGHKLRPSVRSWLT
jgi:hypothetical protein